MQTGSMAQTIDRFGNIQVRDNTQESHFQTNQDSTVLSKWHLGTLQSWLKSDPPSDLRNRPSCDAALRWRKKNRGITFTRSLPIQKGQHNMMLSQIYVLFPRNHSFPKGYFKICRTWMWPWIIDRHLAGYPHQGKHETYSWTTISQLLPKFGDLQLCVCAHVCANVFNVERERDIIYIYIYLFILVHLSRHLFYVTATSAFTYARTGYTVITKMWMRVFLLPQNLHTLKPVSRKSSSRRVGQAKGGTQKKKSTLLDKKKRTFFSMRGSRKQRYTHIFPSAWLMQKVLLKTATDIHGSSRMWPSGSSTERYRYYKHDANMAQAKGAKTRDAYRNNIAQCDAQPNSAVVDMYLLPAPWSPQQNCCFFNSKDAE